jgi:hypothetical protein
LRVLGDVRARPYVADALGQIGDDRARGPLLAMLAGEPYVSTRPHEARALLALGVHDWMGSAPEQDAAARAPADRSRLVVLLSDASASVSASADGQPLEPRVSEGTVWAFDRPPGGAGSAGRPVQWTARTSTGGIVAVWAVAPPHLIDRAGSRK